MTSTGPGAAPRAAVFARLEARRRPRWGVVAAAVAVAVAAAAAAAVLVSRRRVGPAAPRYLTGAVSRGDVVERVRATGTVEPVLSVTVGAQISGRVTRVAVDFNSRVRAGELLAEIDPTPYRAQVAQGRAQLAAARALVTQRRADLTLAERTLARATALRGQGLNAASDLDLAVAQRDAARAAVGVAEAQVAQAAASLESAQNNLTYTRILAPIDGVVATRAVEPGQSVAASLQTPTLFVIVNDLTRMRVIANVDEANIGKLSEGLAATARVDAFPRESFRGTVRTLRITPLTTSGVVTYQAVIEVDDPRARLRPGMTATITAETARREDVLRVPNAALRYRPSDAARDPTLAAGEGGGGGNGGNGGNRRGGRRRDGDGDGDEAGRAERGGVYVVRGPAASRVRVTVGITDGVNTEVSGPGLGEGAAVVIDETDAANAAPRPTMMRPPRMF